MGTKFISGTRPWQDAPAGDRLSAETLDLFFALVGVLKEHLDSRVVEFDLTPMQMFALRSLHEPLPMRQLAELLGCDPSYVTGVADELEQRGALERRPHPSDRRVKLLAITPEGERLRDAVEARLFDGLPLRAGLSDAELAQLRDLLQQVVVAAGDAGMSAAPEAASA